MLRSLWPILIAATCSAFDEESLLSRSGLSGVVPFGDIIFNFDEGYTWSVYHREVLRDCSNSGFHCLYGPRDFRLILPVDCSGIESDSWEFNSIVTIVYSRDHQNGNLLLATKNAPDAIYEYTPERGIIRIFYGFAGRVEMNLDADLERQVRDLPEWMVHESELETNIFRCK